MFDVWRLRTLQELAVQGSMSGAAEKLHLTPSAVSQQISRLERECGVSLVVRDRKSTRLTPEGELLVTFVDQFVTLSIEVSAELKKFSSGEGTQVSISAFGSAAAYLVPTAVRRFSTEFPETQVSLTEMTPKKSLRALPTREVDLAIIDNFELQEASSLESLSLIELFREPVYLVTSRLFAPDSEKPVTLETYKASVWCLNDKDTGYYRHMISLVRQLSGEANVMPGRRSFLSNLALVAFGQGATLQPSIALRETNFDLAIFETTPPIYRTVYGACLAGHPQGAPVRELMATISQFGNELIEQTLNRPGFGGGSDSP